MQEIINAGLVIVANEGIKEVTKSIVNVYIKPKLEKLYKEVKEQKDLDLLEDKIYEYLERSYKRYLYMNTIVFKNSQKTINDLYIPLTVKKSDSVNKKETVEICINKYKDEFIHRYKKILLVDNAGMGKSTIMKYLYLNAIAEEKGVPILLELRKIDKDVDIIDFIMNEINGIGETFNRKDIIDLIKRGDFIFLFDGYDEIKEEVKESLTKNLEKFIGNAQKNEFIISSRDDSSLCCFGDFQRFEVKPLEKEEAYKLLQKYDDNGELSKQLINLLENEENLRIVREFLDNPLMVSLLYLAYGYRKDLPNGKHIFYKQVFNALFLDHDKSKGGAYVHPKKSKLNIDDFHKILRILGFITLKDGVSYSREKLLEYIEKAKKKSFGVDFKESDFLYDLEYVVPLLVKEGNEYRWCHKSFQEYFAACYIYNDSKETQKDILLKMSTDDRIKKYFNVLDFYYDLDYKGFMQNIVYPIIVDMEKFYEDSYGDIKYSNYDREELCFRKGALFKYDKVFIKIISIEEKEWIKKNRGKKDFSQFEYLKSIIEKDCFTEYIPKEKMLKMTISNDEVCVLYNENRISMILDILYRKGNELIKTIEVHNGSYNCVTKLVEKLSPRTYIVNDNCENMLNEKEMYRIVNDYLLNTQHNREIYRFKKKKEMIVFDYDKCIKFKEDLILKMKSFDDDIDYL